MNSETLKGHLGGMLLAILERGPRHGYSIIESLRASSGGQFDLPTGTVYPALHRLERAGLIHAHWDENGGRKRRVYELTAAGQRALSTERESWRDFSAAVTTLLTPGLQTATS
jgi:DNA-binding PadR family transcriptional regulator